MKTKRNRECIVTRIMCVGILSLFILGWSSVSADDYSGTDPVGIYKLQIKEGWNLVSLPLSTIVQDNGRITGISSVSGTVADTDKSWTDDQFKNYLLVIISGDGEGYQYRITGNDSDTLTVSGNVSDEISTGDMYKIFDIPALEDIFGDYTGPLYAASSAASADKIYMWDEDTQAFSIYLWLCNTPGQEGWWKGGTKVIENTSTLLPDEACFVEHMISDTVYLNWFGSVSGIDKKIILGTGSNLVGEGYPAGVSLSDSGLSDMVKEGSSPYAADNIYFWDYESQSFELPIWYYDSHWYQYDLTTIVDDKVIDPTKGLKIINREAEKEWEREKPYTNP